MGVCRLLPNPLQQRRPNPLLCLRPLVSTPTSLPLPPTPVPILSQLMPAISPSLAPTAAPPTVLPPASTSVSMLVRLPTQSLAPLPQPVSAPLSSLATTSAPPLAPHQTRCLCLRSSSTNRGASSNANLSTSTYINIGASTLTHLGASTSTFLGTSSYDHLGPSARLSTSALLVISASGASTIINVNSDTSFCVHSNDTTYHGVFTCSSSDSIRANCTGTICPCLTAASAANDILVAILWLHGDIIRLCRCGRHQLFICLQLVAHLLLSTVQRAIKLTHEIQEDKRVKTLPTLGTRLS